MRKGGERTINRGELEEQDGGEIKKKGGRREGVEN